MLPFGILHSTSKDLATLLPAGAALFLTTKQVHAGKVARYGALMLRDSIALSGAEADDLRNFVERSLRDNLVTREVGGTEWRG
jgi:hypothetical protein